MASAYKIQAYTSDKDIIDKLESVGNKSKYILNLIRKDICGENQNLDEDKIISLIVKTVGSLGGVGITHPLTETEEDKLEKEEEKRQKASKEFVEENIGDIMNFMLNGFDDDEE